MGYERKNIAAMSGYVPGEQPEAPDVVKLNTNENPYPPPKAVAEALASVSVEQLRRYPNPTAETFRKTAAKLHGVGTDQIVATNGGDELLRLALSTFCEPGEPIGLTTPTYSLYAVLAEAHGSPALSWDLGDGWTPPQDWAQQMNDRSVRVAFVVNPHAPSGRLRSVDELAALAGAFNGVLVVDEAYVDFVDPATGHDAVELVRTFDNVLILRTLSKGYSLAGLRFGYGLGAATLIEPILTKTRDSYNTDAVSQALAAAALRGRNEAAETWVRVRAERARLAEALQDLGWPSEPSQTNFLLTTVGDAAAELYRRLKDQGIVVRYFDQDRLRDKLRITIGTPAQNDALIEALGRIRSTTGP